MTTEGVTTTERGNHPPPPILAREPLTKEQMFADRGFLYYLRTKAIRGSDGTTVSESVKALIEAERFITNARTRRHYEDVPADRRRNLDDECGYPTPGNESLEDYQNLFNRSSIANRVVSFWPSETWQVEPEVFEDDDPNVTTPFEQAVADLLDSLNVEENFFEDEKGDNLWRYLYQLDRLSGIGHYGILLLGLDDGLPLDRPIKGVTEVGSVPGKNPTTFPSGDAKKGYKLTNNSTPQDNGSLTLIDPQPYKLTVNKGVIEREVEERDKQGNLTKKKVTEKVSTKRKLIYLRAYSELCAEVSEVETNPGSPRYGKPTKYLVTFHPEADYEQGAPSAGLIQTTQYVHWTRVIHVADNLLDNETYGVPRLEPALNDVTNLNKVYGAAGEGYYKGAFPGHSFETHPSMGGDVNVDVNALRDMYEEYQNGLQRGIFTAGLTVKTLEPQVVDPTNHINRYLEAICVYLECPKRIFMGSERGELASSQDAMQHRGKIKQRQHRYVTPKMIVPLFNRLIWIGCLPPPKTTYKVNWPKVETLDMQSEATFAKTMAEAIAAYINSGCDVLMPPQYFFTVLLGFRDEEVAVWLKDGEAIAEKHKQEEADLRTEEQENALEQTKVAASLKPQPGKNNGKPNTTAINPKPKSK